MANIPLFIGSRSDAEVARGALAGNREDRRLLREHCVLIVGLLIDPIPRLSSRDRKVLVKRCMSRFRTALSWFAKWDNRHPEYYFSVDFYHRAETVVEAWGLGL